MSIKNYKKVFALGPYAGRAEFNSSQNQLEEVLTPLESLKVNQFINKYYDSLFKKTISPYYLVTGRYGITDNYATQAMKLNLNMSVFTKFCSTISGLYRDNFDKTLLENFIK